ncbi:Serpentine receptor class X [Dirofilaria immitis]
MWCTIVLSVKSPALSSPRSFFVRLIVVIFAWIFAMVYCTHHLHSDCALIFHGSLSYRWLHNSELCANFDAAVSILIVMAIGSLDFITLIKILAYRKRIRINTGMPIDGSITERDILFFKQSCKLGLLYISCVFAFNVTPHFFTDKWILFAAGTIAWILVKSLDGLTFLIFNRDLIFKTNFCEVTVFPAINLNLFQTITRQ